TLPIANAIAAPDGSRAALRGRIDHARTALVDLRPGGRAAVHDGWIHSFAAGGRWVVTAVPHVGVAPRQVDTGRPLLRLPSHETTQIAHWLEHPAGARLVWSSLEGDARLVDLRTGSAGRLLGHTAEIVAVARDASGDRLATASLDGTARVWELA